MLLRIRIYKQLLKWVIVSRVHGRSWMSSPNCDICAHCFCSWATQLKMTSPVSQTLSHTSSLNTTSQLNILNKLALMNALLTSWCYCKTSASHWTNNTSTGSSLIRAEIQQADKNSEIETVWQFTFIAWEKVFSLCFKSQQVVATIIPESVVLISNYCSPHESDSDSLKHIRTFL